MATRAGRWIRWWWWLGYLGVQKWAVEERSARMALLATAGVSTLLSFFVASEILERLGVEQHAAAVLGVLLAIVPGFGSARPIARMLYPNLLQRADQSAEKRLSGQAGNS